MSPARRCHEVGTDWRRRRIRSQYCSNTCATPPILTLVLLLRFPCPKHPNPHHGRACQPPRSSLAPPSPTSAVDWSFATPPCCPMPHAPIALFSHPPSHRIVPPSWQGSTVPENKLLKEQRRCDLARPHALSFPGPDRQAPEHHALQSRRGITQRQTSILLSTARIRFIILSFSRLFPLLLFSPSATKLYFSCCRLLGVHSASSAFCRRFFSLPLLLYRLCPTQ